MTDYEWYKSHCICVVCRREKAAPDAYNLRSQSLKGQSQCVEFYALALFFCETEKGGDRHGKKAKKR